MSQNYKQMSRELEKKEDDVEEEQEDGFGWKCCKCICCPLILCFYSCKIYLCGCIFAKCEDVIRWCQACWCACFAAIFCGGCGLCAKQFRDSEFGPENSQKSLGKSDSGVSWLPFEELLVSQGCKENDGKVFVEGAIEPSDISQGGLGDCWWMSALAAVSEHPGCIYQSMRTTRYSPRGCYEFRFYNAHPGEDRWETVEVDNLLPTRNGKDCIYAEMQREAWCALMEKAVAKWCGSYESLDGGSTAWALTALTGGQTNIVMREANGSWKRWESRWRGHKNRTDMRNSNLSRTSKSPTYSQEELWRYLMDHTERKSIMCTSVNVGSSDREAISGLACRHAYSLLGVVECEGFKLVEVRNPWGASGKTSSGHSTGEWQGDWSDASDMWQRYPKVRAALVGKPTNLKPDGKFYMDFSDFVKYFGSISVCSRATGFDDLVMVVDDSQTCGTCVACCCGCCTFWCCCEGVKALCCAEKRRD